LEGQALTNRLAKGPLPPAEIIQVATQIASALDQAHRLGIIHRDLKPANIMLTKSGAKLLDFGLANAPEVTTGPDDATLTETLTAAGSIVGTLQYMAPEQFEGVKADARSDVFSFGAVLYEMATGRRAFQGASKLSVIAAIMNQHPPPLA